MQTLRPLTIAELLDRAFVLYREHFLIFVLIAAVPNGILALLQLVTDTLSFNPMLVVAMGVVMLAGTLIAQLVSQGVTVLAVSQMQLGLPTSATEAFHTIRGRVGELAVLALNVGLRVMLWTLVFIIPGVIAGLRYSLAAPVAILEEVGVSESLERSRTLTKGHLGRIFLIYVLLIVMLLIGGAAWSLVMRGLAFVAPGAAATPTPLWARTVNGLGTFLVNTVTGPIVTIAFSLIYYDERVRKEGFDLEHMMQQLDPAASNPSTLA